MTEITSSFLLVYAALFPIVNPIGGAPLFLGLTRHLSSDQRHALAGRVAANGFLLLLGSVLVGSHVLEFFGITLPVVGIAGGLTVTAFGWSLLQAGDADGDRHDVAADPDGVDAFYPLTMPLTVGPGSISVAVTLGSQRPRPASGLAELALSGVGAVLGLAAVALSIFLCYRFADRVMAVLGRHGSRVLVRLSAFVMLCIGIQILWNGVRALLAIPSPGS